MGPAGPTESVASLETRKQRYWKPTGQPCLRSGWFPLGTSFFGRLSQVLNSGPEQALCGKALPGVQTPRLASTGRVQGRGPAQSTTGRESCTLVSSTVLTFAFLFTLPSFFFFLDVIYLCLERGREGD